MTNLSLHDYYQTLGASFAEVNGMEVVQHFGNVQAECDALQKSAGVLDLSFRGRLCLVGQDRQRFLHGQVTNDVRGLAIGEGCYAALTTAKGKMQSDLNIYCLEDELLLDFEPGLNSAVQERLDKYVIAEEVEIIDVATSYGLLSIQGPAAPTILAEAGLGTEAPAKRMKFSKVVSPGLGEIYCMNQPRTGSTGFDLFVPTPALRQVAERLMLAARSAGGRACGWAALELARIEAGIPRFGADMDETNLPPETGIEARAVSYTKGCYIGQEVIARIRTYGQVAKQLQRLQLAPHLQVLPGKGAKLFHGEKEAGYITSAAGAPFLKANIALGYVRRELQEAGTELTLHDGTSESSVRIIGVVNC